jgi:peptidoglycan hydrolase CwlO-like protein
MKRKILIVMAGLLLLSVQAYGQEVYKWVDEKGMSHFTDDLSQVPEKYREQAAKKTSKEESASTPSAGSLPGVGSGQNVEQPIEQKDALGRGEEWWRAKVKEWNNKLKNAQKDLADAQETLKQKEKELEDTTYSHYNNRHGMGAIRKLNAEIEGLNSKIPELESRVNEAKNMLENVLPQEAKDSRANPNWLNP